MQRAAVPCEWVIRRVCLRYPRLQQASCLRGVSSSRRLQTMSIETIVIVVVIVLIVLFVLGYFGRGRFRG
jgi:hypothetical protein